VPCARARTLYRANAEVLGAPVLDAQVLDAPELEALVLPWRGRAVAG
jgi:hypothetical protein